MRPLRVLLITRECLRTDSNEGNVLLNLFTGQPVELANIYCKPGLPDTDICTGYFQLTDRMALDKILHRTPMGKVVGPSEQVETETSSGEHENKAFYNFFRIFNFTTFHCLRELLWKLADFRSPKLDSFVTQFAPDIIFAPMSYSWFVLAVQRYVIQLSNAPAVTYIYDDLYSLKQYHFSPIYWAHRLLQRRAIRKTIPYYQFAYTMSEQQAEEYGSMLNIPMKVLRKCYVFSPEESKREARDEVRIIYAGGIYFGRDKTLSMVADCVRSLRKEGCPVSLDVYTASPLSRKSRKHLDDGDGCRVHPVVSAAKLKELYGQSDIALHVESFQKKNALVTRLSFSTKIVDCLASGCAVLAICPPINAGWQYLKSEDAALCIGDKTQIEGALRRLVNDAKMREEYANQALECLRRNHNETQIKQKLYDDFTDLIGAH